MRSRWFGLSLNDGQLAELAFQGLLPHIKERFSSQEFESFSNLVSRLANVDVRARDPRREAFQKRVNFVGDSSDSESDAKIGVADWAKSKKAVPCPFTKKELRATDSTSERLIGSLTCCYRRDDSDCPLTM